MVIDSCVVSCFFLYFPNGKSTGWGILFFGFIEANGEQSRSNLEEHQASKKLASDAWKNSRCHMSEDPVRQQRSIAQTQGSSQ